MAQTMTLYRRQAWADALAVLTQHGDQFPDEADSVLYLQSCLAARVGQPDLALSLMQQALDRGFWYDDLVLRKTPSWQPLQGLPAFEQMAAVCAERQQAADAHARPERLVAEPAAGTADQRWPLLLVLHGNRDNATRTLAAWQAATADGWLVAALQSSQVTGYQAYMWNNQTIAQQEVEAHYAALAAIYPIDPTRVILAGFSMGGETALRLALLRAVPARGFILVAPGGPTIAQPDAWHKLAEQVATQHLRGYIVGGEQDWTMAPDALQAVADVLQQHQISCDVEVVPTLGHDYPEDMRPYMQRAMQFIAQEPLVR
jgi:predicted esterase